MIWSSRDGPARGGVRLRHSAQSCDWEELSGQEATRGSHPADHAHVEALREQELEAAYRRGRADGEQAAHARARKEVETAASAARHALQQVRENRESWNRRLEEVLVGMATAIARQIIERELKGDVESFRALVHKAAVTFPLDHVVKVRLHPSDLAQLAEANDGQAPAEGDTDGRETRWVADPDVIPGGCIVEGPDRIMDGRVDAALERIYLEMTRG